MLEISEIFGPTIQGEGKKIGTPSVFIRFGKCNMNCSGFNVAYTTPNGETKYSCDSYYAVDNVFKTHWKRYEKYEDIVKEVEQLFLGYNPDIVITGGEPLIYWNNQEFQKLLEYFVVNNFSVTIETNGSLSINFTQAYQKEILFSLSVKLSNCGETSAKRINLKALTTILNETKESYLKFVINKTFINEAKKEIDEILNQIPAKEVYLMPMGETVNELNDNAKEVIAFAIQNNFKYSDRLHIRVWDNKRGV